jgi:hypothetical protein
MTPRARFRALLARITAENLAPATGGRAVAREAGRHRRDPTCLQRQPHAVRSVREPPCPEVAVLGKVVADRCAVRQPTHLRHQIEKKNVHWRDCIDSLAHGWR